MNEKIKNIEKEIKKSGKLEKFFRWLYNNVIKVKCGAAFVLSALVIATIYMPKVYYYILGSIAIVGGIDLIVENITHYSVNLSGKFCKKYSSKKRELEKERAKLVDEMFCSADKEEIEKTKNELGLNSEVVMEKTGIKRNEEKIEQENEQ